MSATAAIVDRMLDDSRNGWSIGTFGAVGEFMRDADEPVEDRREGDARALVTDRAGIRINPHERLVPIAYDTLSSDGETWGQAVAFCLPKPPQMEQGAIRALGRDPEALREQDRGDELFDLGVGLGHVYMHIRTADEALIAALRAIEGKPLFGAEAAGLMGEILRAQPHRVLTSPAGRIEVYAPIPARGDQSPPGPHTHLLPKLLATRRTHAANSPIPADMQPVLMLSPASPWRDAMGRRIPFEEGLDTLFGRLMQDYGLRADREVSDRVRQAVHEGLSPDAFAWPDSRRGRTKARITLRRLARTGANETLAKWRNHYDRTPVDAEEEVLD